MLLNELELLREKWKNLGVIVYKPFEIEGCDRKAKPALSWLT